MEFVNQLRKKQVIVSYESKYLKNNDWCQLALFGFYEEKDLLELIKILEKMLASLDKID